MTDFIIITSSPFIFPMIISFHITFNIAFLFSSLTYRTIVMRDTDNKSANLLRLKLLSLLYAAFTFFIYRIVIIRYIFHIFSNLFFKFYFFWHERQNNHLILSPFHRLITYYINTIFIVNGAK